MANITLRVDPERLKQTAEDLRLQAENARNAVVEIQRCTAQTQVYWEGDAGSYTRPRMDKECGKAEKILSRMKGDPARLLTMAGIYQQAEQSNVQTAQALKINVID